MSISLNDGKSTPVAHVFTQDAFQDGNSPAVLRNRASVNGPLFYESIESTMTLGDKKNPANRAKVVLTSPKEGTKDGNPAVLGVNKLYISLVCDPASSGVADVKDLLAMGKDFLQKEISSLSTFTPTNAP